MIPIELLRRFWPYLIALALVAVMYAWHVSAVSNARKEGRQEVQQKWDEAKIIQQAEAEKQNRIHKAEQDEQHARAQKAEQALQVANAARILADADWQRRVDRLRKPGTVATTANRVPKVYVGTRDQYTEALRTTVVEGLTLLGEYRSTLDECSAELIRYRDSWPVTSLP